MANQLAEYMPERFAGFGAVGSPYYPFTEEDFPEASADSIHYAYSVIYGTAEGEYSPEKMELQVKRAMVADNMDKETEAVTTYNGQYTESDYYDEESGLPLIKHICMMIRSIPICRNTVIWYGMICADTAAERTENFTLPENL